MDNGMDHYVVEYTREGKFVAVISGMGRNKGTWDTAYSKRSAQRHAAVLRKENPSLKYVVETL